MFLLLVYLFFTIAISFLCSILEATLMSVPMSYVVMKDDEGYKPAAKMLAYKQDPSRPIAAILALNTIANTVGAALIGHQATVVMDASWWFGLVSGATTVAILLFAEIIPKTIGNTNCKSLMGFATRTISALVTVLFPIVICVQWFQKIITPKEQDAAISREEVSAMADVAEESGELDEDENEIIQNLISLDEVTVSDSMTPRVVCEIANEQMTVKNFCKDRRFYHHSRIPLFADNDEYITGYILRVEALQLMAEDKFDVKLKDIRRDVSAFNEDAPISEVWGKMIEDKEQIVIVVNEYGSFQGILTLEDVIETILGDEIVDERDAVVDMQELAREKWEKRIANKKAKPVEKTGDEEGDEE